MYVIAILFFTSIISLRKDRQKLSMPTIFQVVMTGYWVKFSISNNRASDKPHRLRYCHCAKLKRKSITVSITPNTPRFTETVTQRRSQQSLTNRNTKKTWVRTSVWLCVYKMQISKIAFIKKNIFNQLSQCIVGTWWRRRNVADITAA